MKTKDHSDSPAQPPLTTLRCENVSGFWIPFSLQKTVIFLVRYSHSSTVQMTKLSDRDLQAPNAGDTMRKMYGDPEANQIQDTLNRAIRGRTQVFLAYRPDLSKPKPTVSSSSN